MTGSGDPKPAFKDAEVALLVGARPRGPGMERKDLLLENAKIFTAQGKALDAVAERDVKVLVVGNPANTNAYIAMKLGAVAAAGRTSPPCSASTTTAPLSQLAAKAGVPVGVDRAPHRLGQPFADDVSRLPLRHRRAALRSRP